MLNPVSGQLPPRKIAPRLGIGVWVKVRVSFRVGGRGGGGEGSGGGGGGGGGGNCPRTVKSFHVGFFLKKLLMGVSVYRGLDLRIFFSFFCFLHFILK